MGGPWTIARAARAAVVIDVVALPMADTWGHLVLVSAIAKPVICRVAPDCPICTVRRPDVIWGALLGSVFLDTLPVLLWDKWFTPCGARTA